jgi:hypothetical protein
MLCHMYYGAYKQKSIVDLTSTITWSRGHKIRDDVILVRAFIMNADGLWFNPGSEGFFRASYSENE